MKKQDTLQAVVVADSFDCSFTPITNSIPKCLLPIANIPIIDYVLESLSQVQEIFIICSSHSQQIINHLKSSKYTHKIQIIISKQLQSMGDALREIDNIVSCDFILINADTITNLDLTIPLLKHSQLRIHDKNAIMTILLKQSSLSTALEKPLVILDSNTLQCIHYDTLPPKNTRIDLQTLSKHSELELRNDVYDCQIYFCSILVPALFTENFDYQDIRRDFIKGVLESDIYGNTLYCHILTDKYAARAYCPIMYDSISKDIMKRWTWPLVPDSNWNTDSNYSFLLPSIYRDSDVLLAKSTVLDCNVIIAKGTKIGNNTKISNSVIGKNCIIGDSVSLDGVYLLDNVVIGNNTTICNSIIGYNCKVGSGVTINKGVLFGNDVKIENNSTILPQTRWISCNSSLYAVPFVPDSDEEQDSQTEYISWGSEIKRKSSYEDDTVTETDGDLAVLSDEEGGPEEIEWKREQELTLERAFNENHTVEIAALELNTLKMAFNITFSDLRSGVVPAIIKQLDFVKPAESVKKIFGKWTLLLDKFTHTREDQLHVLNLFRKENESNPELEKLMPLILHILYEQELLEEDVILDWFDELPQDSLKLAASPFVTWLEDAEEESDDDDDE